VPEAERPVTPQSLSDDALFVGVQERDPAAWEAFVDRFGPLIAAVPGRAGLAPDQVDDVVQATWMQLLRHAKLIRTPRSLPSWILTTAARETWRLQARENVRRSIEQEGALGTTQERTTEVDLLQLERIQVVRDAVSQLGEPCSRLLKALFLAPTLPSYTELAKKLGIPVGSIGPTRQRCLARLAQGLARSGVSSAGQDST
jgi:RNA polymerase sigma factor (sigma-70 family)